MSQTTNNLSLQVQINITRHNITLFIIVLEALSREFREGLPMELLYADDLVLVAETEELLIEKLRKWKRGMELKGLRVNIGKTKVMIEVSGENRPG